MTTSVAAAARPVHAPVVTSGRRRWSWRRSRHDTIALAFLLPTLVYVLAVTFYPAAYAIGVSLHRTKYLVLGAFVGLEHYGRFLADAAGRNNVLQSLVYMGASVTIALPLGLGVAILLNRPIRLRAFFRGAVIVPWLISQVATGLLWGWLVNPQYGPVPYLVVALSGVQPGFLGDPSQAMATLVLANVWRSFALPTLLFLAALQSVPREMLEAAVVDGAGGAVEGRVVVVAGAEAAGAFEGGDAGAFGGAELGGLHVRVAGAGGAVHAVVDLAGAEQTRATAAVEVEVGDRIGIDQRGGARLGQRLAEWIAVAGAYAMFDGVKSPLTQTFGLGVFEPVTEAVLEKIEDFFERHSAPVAHEISPMADASLLQLLHENNYHPIELTSVMYRPITRDFRLAAPRNDFGFVKSGTLMLCRTRHGLDEETRTAGEARALGLEAEVLEWLHDYRGGSPEAVITLRTTLHDNGDVIDQWRWSGRRAFRPAGAEAGLAAQQALLETWLEALLERLDTLADAAR